MKRILMSLVISATLLPAAAWACDGEMKAEATIKKTTVGELAKNSRAKVVDANTADFRAKNGTIPGALLLTSATEYAVSELPAQKDQALVFYCANTMCSASDAAAQRASAAGYTNVAVLPEGLMGWKQAGQKTAAVKPNT